MGGRGFISERKPVRVFVPAHVTAGSRWGRHSWNDINILYGNKNKIIRENLLRVKNLPHYITQALLKPNYNICDVNTDKII